MPFGQSGSRSPSSMCMGEYKQHRGIAYGQQNKNKVPASPEAGADYRTSKVPTNQYNKSSAVHEYTYENKKSKFSQATQTKEEVDYYTDTSGGLFPDQNREMVPFARTAATDARAAAQARTECLDKHQYGYPTPHVRAEHKGLRDMLGRDGKNQDTWGDGYAGCASKAPPDFGAPVDDYGRAFPEDKEAAREWSDKIKRGRGAVPPTRGSLNRFCRGGGTV